ncbi:hypothetical protein [Sporosarcina psychrophila]|uniref:Uncharacterized protein n=1 Tax=Sporosarcina psychrophila TaxID=1476 RepID=A0ABV2K9P5_SPOPS
MNWMEIWEKIVLPIVQYLIGPIIAGYTVWFFTNRKTVKREKDETERQCNAIAVKLRKIIEEIKILDQIKRDLRVFNIRIEEMEDGDFSGVDDEVDEKEGDEDEVLWMFRSRVQSMAQKIEEKYKEIVGFNIELTELPKDLIQPKIHKDLLGFIESEKVYVDMAKYHLLLEKLEKVR